MKEQGINNLAGGSQWESEKHPTQHSIISTACNCAESANVADVRKSGTRVPSGFKPYGRINQCVRAAHSDDVSLLITDDGTVALVDREDEVKVNQFHWSVKLNRNKSPYVHACGAGYLHRFVLGFSDLRSMKALGVKRCYVDHVNYDTLDCRKSNLRPCTQSENGAAARRPNANKWNYRGIRLFRGNRWMAQLGRKYGGVFKTPEEAARAYDRLAREAWGDFATLNFPECGTVHGEVR